MEEGAQEPHRNKKLRRQQQDGQSLPQTGLTAAAGKNREHHAQCRAAVGHEIHHHDGVQLHHQHLHGDFSEAFRLRVHFRRLPAVRAVDLQRGEALEILEEAVPERRVAVPVLPQQTLRDFLHQHDGHRNQRHAEQQHETRPETDAAERQKQGERRQQTVEQLRQITAEIGFQLFNAFGHELHGLRRRHLLMVSRAQTAELFKEKAAQPGFHRRPGQAGAACSIPGAKGPQKRSSKQKHSCLRQCRRNRLLQRVRCLPQSEHDEDRAEQPRPLPADLRKNIFPGVCHEGE